MAYNNAEVWTAAMRAASSWNVEKNEEIVNDPL